MRGIQLLATLAIAALSPRTEADDVLPSLTFQADPSTNGAKLKVGFDLVYGVPVATTISPFFQASTDNGVADLFVLDSKGVSVSASWQVGAVASFLRWPASPRADAEASGRTPTFKAMERAAYHVCSAYCADPRTQAIAGNFCEQKLKAEAKREAYARSNTSLDPALSQAFVDRDHREADAKAAEGRAAHADSAHREAAAAEATSLRELSKQANDSLASLLEDRVVTGNGLDIQDYCTETKVVLEAYLEARYDPWSAIPSQIMQIGISAGATVNKYLDPGPGGGLTVRNPTHSSESLGFMFVKIHHGWAFEFPELLQRSFKLGSTKTAKWCVPAGTVTASDGTTVPAQTCNEQPIGPLARHYTAQLAFVVSRFAPTSFWRIGLGGVASYSPKEGSETSDHYKLGVVAPLYLGTNLLKKDLKCLARISVGAFTSQSGDGTTDRSFVVSVAILANSTLFPSVFDQF